jgi:glycosyltransferase involved in cell wall biosynthesis
VQEFGPAGQTASKPTVSVIVPTRNRPALLTRALASIAEQTFADFEVIVVNDGGTDVTAVIAKAHLQGRPLRCITHPSSLGAAAARNSGIRMSRGDYIAYLDDDDIYYPNHLEVLIHTARNTGARFFYSQSVHAKYSPHDGRRLWHRLHSDKQWDLECMLSRNRIPTLAVMHQRNCLDTTGYFDETLRTHEDWDLWIRMMQHFPAVYVAEATCEFQTRSGPDALTVGHRQNFLETMRAVHSRYLHLAEDRARVQQQQQAVAQRLEAELFGPLKLLTPTLRWLNNARRTLMSGLGDEIMPRLKALAMQIAGFMPQPRRRS